jgi:polyisoprenoid-binding protein YceI
MRLNELLSEDHARLDRTFESIVGEASGGDPFDLRDEWRAFERELVGHMDAEEAHLLRLFAQDRPDEARALRSEHKALRDRLTELGMELDLHCLNPVQVRGFVEELRAHVRREEELLYPWASRELGEMAEAELRLALSGKRRELPPRSKEVEWAIDTQRSSLRFSLRHIVVHEIRGTFARWGGAISLDEGAPTRSSVRIWIDLSTIDTGEQERDQHVLSPEFFDVARFPKATFTSVAVRAADRGNPVVRGVLDLHGVRQEIDMEVTGRERRPAEEGDDGCERMIFTARGRLDRRQFGLRWNQDLDVGGIVVGDDIEITAQVAAVRPINGNASKSH